MYLIIQQKTDLKNSTSADTSSQLTLHLVRLKLETDKLGNGKLETTPVDLKKLSDVVDEEVVKKNLYDELIKNVNANQTNDTSDLILKNYV